MKFYSETAWLEPCLLGIRSLELATEHRQERKELMTHLFRMHGFSSMPGLKLTLPELKELHERLHFDDYALPPHSHSAEGEIVLTLGKRYIEKRIEAIRASE